MKFKWYIVIGIFLLITYFLFPILFGLAIFFIIVYIIYKIYNIIQRFRTPHGKRIKHGLLKSYLEAKYGRREGDSLYKEFISELRKKGYR